MKLVTICCFLLPVFAPACFSQSKTAIDVYIELDGKPLKGASVSLTGDTKRFVNSDWVLPIITPKAVGVIGETGTPAVEVPAWMVVNKTTDKSGRFRVAAPVGLTITGMVDARRLPLPALGKPNAEKVNAWAEKIKGIPCGMFRFTIAAQSDTAKNVRFTLSSARAHGAKEGCLMQGMGDSNGPPIVVP
jgi:hypothetical protein